MRMDEGEERKKGRDVDKYLMLLGNYSVRSTDPMAVPHLSSSSHLQFVC